MVHWGLYTVVGKKEPWIITPEVMYLTGYVSRRLLFKKKLNSWDLLENLWQQIHEDQLGAMWRDVVACPPDRIL